MFIIVCDIGSSIGLGHYYRCLSLKNALEKQLRTVELIVCYLDADDYSGLDADILIDGSFCDNYERFDLVNSVVILDLMHRMVDFSALERCLVEFKKLKNKLVIIEGLDDDSCPAIFYHLLDALFTPYLTKDSDKKNCNHFIGKDYMMIDKDRILQSKKIRKNAKKILITFGGSDPYGQSRQILDIFVRNLFIDDLEFMVIIGHLIKDAEVTNLLEYKNLLNIKFVHAPQNLAEYFDWADLAITNTGQTRYELAASGVPFIILPFDISGYNNSLVFQDFGAAYLADRLEILCENKFLRHVYSLLDSEKIRLNMSQSGRNNFYSSDSLDNFAKALVGICH